MTAEPYGVPYPVTYDVNADPEAIHRRLWGMGEPSPVAQPGPSPSVAPVAATYWGPSPAKRQTVLARLIARFKKDGAPAASRAALVGGAEPRDLAERGRDVEVVTAQRLSEPSQR